MSDTRTNVLVVDDSPSNLQLLVKLMQLEGYKVRPARSGAAALALLQEIRPDVILLDINMPEMDGFEVCRRLKAEPLHRDIPVVFVSAMQDTRDKVKAFEAGATDYITKPFQMEEVRMRIETHLHMARMKAELEVANRKLQESERLHEMLTHLVAHDMRTPLFSVMGMSDLLSLNTAVIKDPEASEFVADIHDSSLILVSLITDMLDVYKHDCGNALAHPKEVLFEEVIREAMKMLGGIARSHPFSKHLPEEPIPVRCDKNLTVRVLVNLLSNAFRFTAGTTPVTLSAAKDGAFLKVGVKDEGTGISGEDQARLFRKFGRLEGTEKSVRYSSGLGLVFCRMVVEAQGGQIGIVSAPGSGSLFWFTLPLA